jgi:hypothetical protein
MFAGFTTFSPEELTGLRIISGAVLLYVFAYALLAVLLHRKVFPRRSPRLAGVFMVLLPALWALLPGIFFFFINRLSWRSLQELQLGNVFNLTNVDEAGRMKHLMFAGIWLAVMIAINAKWFITQVKHFQPLVRRAQSSESTPAPPPIPASTTGVLEG